MTLFSDSTLTVFNRRTVYPCVLSGNNTSINFLNNPQYPNQKIQFKYFYFLTFGEAIIILSSMNVMLLDF